MTNGLLYYPEPPPHRDGESDDEYTNRMLGKNSPYDHHRYRQCSIGWHSECSQNGAKSGQCECPHHHDPRLVSALAHIEPLSSRFGLTGAIDVAVDILTDTNKPLRELIRVWHELGDTVASMCADELEAVLNGGNLPMLHDGER